MTSVSSKPRARLGDRSLFTTLGAKAYLNHAAIAPLSDPARAAVRDVLDAYAEQGSLAFAEVLARRQRLREKLAQLLRATPETLALVPSTAHGLSLVALSLPHRPGERIVCFAGEYPTNVHVWQRAAALFGLEVVLLPLSDFAHPSGPDLERLQGELVRGNVRVVAVSAVQFQTGLRMPLAELAALCHAHGAELAVDAVQAAGAVPLDMLALGVDYLAAGAHKWLMGIDGLGVLYVRQGALSSLRPAITGAMSYEGGIDPLTAGPGHLRYDRPLLPTASVFEGGMLSSTASAALDASLELLLSLGIDAIFAHANAYLDALEPQLCARGFRSLRMADAARRSCTLALEPPRGVGAVAFSASLCARGVVVSAPDGLLRLAPHWPNGLEEIPAVVGAVDEALAELRDDQRSGA